VENYKIIHQIRLATRLSLMYFKVPDVQGEYRE
jgi:hypothetical protein